MTKKYTFRKLIHVMHLWVGLACTLVLFVMCLTGTMYVFNREITQWVDQEKFHVEVPAQGNVLTLAQLMAAVQRENKELRISGIQVPERADEAWTFSLLKKAKPEAKKETKGAEKGEKKAPKKEKPTNLLVNPYTGKIQGNAQTPTAQFFATVLQLHRWLLIENHDIGGAITGTAALGMILLQITGLLLWLPAKLSSWKKWNVWKPGFKIKTDASGKRLNFDLHKTLGFYAFVFVTIMALTGPVFAWEWYRTGYRQLMGVFTPREEKALETDAKGRQPLALEAIIRQSNQVFPYSGVLRLTLPKDSVGTLIAQKSQNGFFASAGVDRLTLDPYTGQILKLERFGDKTLGEKIAVSAKIIHTGELYGTFTKILYFLACLMATSLPITGFLIWWKRGKAEAAKPVARPAGTARVRPRAVVQAVRE